MSDPESWLVVGGSHGTGLHLVNSLIGAGESVDVVGRRESPRFVEGDGRLTYHQCDLARREDVRALLNELIQNRNPFSRLVLLQRYRGDGADWDAELEVCLTSTRLILDSVPDLMRRTQGGGVALVGSVAQNLVFPDQPASYHIVKAGLRQLVRYYAVKLGSAGIRVNIVVPATVLKEEARSYYDANPELLRQKAEASPLGRMGTPEDVSQAVLFLNSQKASFITGQELVVDGGISLLAHEYSAK